MDRGEVSGMSEQLGTNLAEVSTDTISRQAAIDALCRVDEYNGRSIEAIRQLPPAQPKKGRWISADAMFHGVPFYCSECGENTRDTVMGKPRWKYCPMCGSYNGGEKDDSV